MGADMETIFDLGKERTTSETVPLFQAKKDIENMINKEFKEENHIVRYNSNDEDIVNRISDYISSNYPYFQCTVDSFESEYINSGCVFIVLFSLPERDYCTFKVIWK